MTIREAKIYIRSELSDFYPENEISSFIRILFSDLLGLSMVQVVSKERDCLKTTEVVKIKKVIRRLKNYEPLQYIIGHTDFFGLRFCVSRSVLIPRPETEELVDLIIEENKSKEKLKILDIGTGSGCIAVSLAKNISLSVVSSIDVSKDALKIAKRNALKNKVEVVFAQEDIIRLSSEPPEFKNPLTNFDIIVSNPPYVTVSEKQQMSKNILDFEPETALFVEDDNPLVFYEAVVRFARQHLSVNGRLYFEINERFGDGVKNLMVLFGFSGVEVVKDINGKDRIVKGVK